MKYLDTEIREMVEEDLEQVMEIEHLCFKHPYKRGDFLHELYENEYATILVIELSNSSLNLKQVCGFVDFWKTFDSGTICQIAIHPELQKMGLGSELLKEVIMECKVNRVRFLALEVRVSNTKAINFYKKHGFKEVVIKPQYYTDGEDAIYMVLEVKI